MSRSLMLLSALLVALSACSDPTAPVDVGTIPDGWTARVLDYSQIRLHMTERPDDHVLKGDWAGDRAGCSSQFCTDNGIVIGGTRSLDHLSFTLTASNAARSVHFEVTMHADSSMTGTAQLTENGARSSVEGVTFRRH